MARIASHSSKWICVIKREEDNNKCEKKDKKKSSKPQRKDVPSSRYGKGDLVAKPAPVLRQPSLTLPRSGGLNDDFSSPRSFIASRKSAASSRHAKLAKSVNAKGDDNIEDCSDEDTPTSKVTFPKLPSSSALILGLPFRLFTNSSHFFWSHIR